jgi:hypothetical protein
MADSASISIILNAGGNLGTVLDGATGKVVRLGNAARGAGGAVAREAQVATGSIAALGEQASRAFGSAGSALAKFAGPLGALGGVSAVAGASLSKALDLAHQKFTAMIEAPVRLTEEIQKAAAAAGELAKARDAAVLAGIDKVAGSAEPLVARGGDALLAQARQISTATGVPLEDVSKAVSAASDAGMGPDAMRRLVEGAHLVARSGRMSYDDAVKAGVANRVGDGSAAEIAAGMVNREGRLAFENRPMDDVVEAIDAHAAAQDEARAAHRAKQRADFDRAQAAWNAGGMQGERPRMPADDFVPAPFVSPVTYKPAATAADFAAAAANLAASPLASAVQDKRIADATTSDAKLREIAAQGQRVVAGASADERVDRDFPGLRKFLDEDRKMQAQIDLAQSKQEAWSWSPFSEAGDEVVRLSEERSRKADAFRRAGGFVRKEAPGETVDEFNARVSADKDRLDSARRAAGVPFGEGTAKIEALLGEISSKLNTAPAPIPEAQ